MADGGDRQPLCAGDGAARHDLANHRRGNDADFYLVWLRGNVSVYQSGGDRLRQL